MLNMFLIFKIRAFRKRIINKLSISILWTLVVIGPFLLRRRFRLSFSFIFTNLFFQLVKVSVHLWIQLEIVFLGVIVNHHLMIPYLVDSLGIKRFIVKVVFIRLDLQLFLLVFLGRVLFFESALLIKGFFFGCSFLQIFVLLGPFYLFFSFIIFISNYVSGYFFVVRGELS